jgi:preprotein translocase subunit SecD
MLQFPPWKVWLVAVVCALGVIFAIPNTFSAAAVQRLPNWLPKRQVSLGLDLQGGSYLLYRVDMSSVVHDQLNNIVDALREQLLDRHVGYTGGLKIADDHIVFGVRDPDQVDDVRAAVTKVAPELQMTVGKDDEVTLGFSPTALNARTADAVSRSIEIIRRRIDQAGVKEPTIEREGNDRIVVELPGVADPQRLKQLIGKTARLTFQLVDTGASVEQALEGHLPPGDKLLSAEGAAGSSYGPQQYVVHDRIIVGGGELTDAQPTFQNNEPVVSFTFDALGARRFAEATRANVGEPLAIVLDNKVISAPVIREPILDGRGVISGNATVQSASDLALLLRAGALPAPLTTLEERTVGPGLGLDSIRDGELSCLVAVALVTVFMVLFYGLFGLFADIALFFNLCLIIGALSVLGATLTLPGIAGIALTLGMAVDANVLVYERIREEVRAGRSTISALDAGYRRAFGTILDSHITTLVAGALLYYFGEGPVKGFAVTLSIGVLTSLFSALLVTRLLIVSWLRQTRPKAIPI